LITIVGHGIEFGIVLTFLVGPVFFTILQTSLEAGFWKGVLVAVGVSLSDIFYVVICYFGVAQWAVNANVRIFLAYGGGIILIAFGLYHLLIKSRRQLNTLKPVSEKRRYQYVLKGFVINGMTPMVLFFWVATVSFATVHYGYSSGQDFSLFFLGMLGTILSTDILKAFLADKVRRLITPRSMTIMNILIGLILFAFGCKLLFVPSSLPLP
jgi:threonine/homoserine/homoserine lactone efflux protein